MNDTIKCPISAIQILVISEEERKEYSNAILEIGKYLPLIKEVDPPNEEYAVLLGLVQKFIN